VLFCVNIQFLAQPHCQTETGDEAVDGQILGDLVFAVNNLQNQFSLWLFQLIDYNVIPRDEALEKARADAIELAVAAGAIRETVEIIDAEDVPLQYYPGNTARVKIKAAGDLA